MVTAIPIAVFHLLVLIAVPLTYTPLGLISFIVMYCLTVFGIGLGYHRLLTHCSFKAIPPVKYLLTLLGILALQGGPSYWVATHRLHHAKTDREGDPHSPAINRFLWSHVLWLFFHHPNLKTQADYQYFARDMFQDRGIAFLDKSFLWLNILLGLLLFGGGCLAGGWKAGISLLMWGGFLRIVAVWHVTWFVNSATHIWGYRNYNLSDQSRNNWWVALLSFGEGWHNNHHAEPRTARNGHRWFEIDVSYWMILLMSRLGLIYDVVPMSGR